MRKFVCLLVLAGLICGATVAVVAAADADAPVTFTFAPPIGSYVEQVSATQSMIAPGNDGTPVVSTSRVRTTVSKDGNGYMLLTDPLSFEAKENGAVVTDAVTAAVQKVPVTWRVYSDGRLKALEGYDRVLKDASKVASKDQMKALEIVLSEKLLAERARANWNARIGALAGQTARKNTVWIGENVSPMLDGTLAHYYYVTLYDGMVEKDGRKLARLRLLFTTDGDSIHRQVNDLVHDVVPGVPAPPAITLTKGFTISGDGELLMDPSTMLVWSEKSSRRMTFPVSTGKDRTSLVVMEESRETSIVAPPPKG